MKLHFSGHLDMFFGNLPPSEKIAKFTKLGFPAVELWCWWDYDLDELIKASQNNNTAICAICTKFVSLTDFTQRYAYLSGLRESIEVCEKMKCKTIITTVGVELSESTRKQQKQSIIDGLKNAAELLSGTKVTLVVEPLNTLVDHQGAFLSSSEETAEIIDSVDSSSVKMLFDVYHQQISEGNLINNINKYFSKIGHFHIADTPGRYQPGTGEINYENVFKVIKTLGYNGFIGIEFSSDGNEEETLNSFINRFCSSN